MEITFLRLALAAVSASMVAISGCGGGGGSAGTDVPVTVIDGAIQNAKVCLDKNSNGVCDSGEPAGRTDSAGKVTLKVDPPDVGKFPIVAEIGTDALDADTGPVQVAFSLKAPADKTAIVSPLTTLVQTIMEGSGLSSAAAEVRVKGETGLNASLFDDFTKGGDADSKAAGTMARLVVVTTQQQIKALVGTVGTAALDGSLISKQNLEKAILKRMAERMDRLKTAATNPGVLGAGTAQAKEAALLVQADALVAASDLTADAVGTVVAVNNQEVAPGADTGAALEQAKKFLNLYEASFATAIPGTGATRNAFSDGCYLGDGLTKPVAIALFDANVADAVASNRFRVGSTRTNVQVLADRVTTNSDGSSRRELDLAYQVNFTDGTVDPNGRETLISGSSLGSVMAPGQTCTTPQSGSNWRLYGNRSLVDAQVRAVNSRQKRYSLSTGAALPFPINIRHGRYIYFRIKDPSGFAKYVVITGTGLPSAGVKMVSPRIMRDDPLFAGKAGRYVDWKDDDRFRYCRGSTSTSDIPAAADIANCGTFGAAGTYYGASGPIRSATDTAFDALGFVAGSVYTIAVYDDDGWKTANGHAGRTPVASYSRVLANLPYRAADLAGLGVGGGSSSLTASQVGANIRNITPFSIDLSWPALTPAPGGARYGWGDIYFYVEGPAIGAVGGLPRSRQYLALKYPAPGSLNMTGIAVGAAVSPMAAPSYGEVGLEVSDRNGRWYGSFLSFE